jgi:nucleoside-diphosphate-sugar epimerase
MKIAILGATSEIARDMIERFDLDGIHELVLFSRSKEAIENWVKKINLKNRFCFFGLDEFSLNVKFDILINFIGSGDPLKTSSMGSSIINITQYYDDMALSYISKHNECVYIFISSGASYGTLFNKPVNEKSLSVFPINNLGPSDWYGIAKFYAECRHRAMDNLSIIDLRIFNYFSSTQDMSSRYLMTDIVRAIKSNQLFLTSKENIYRDFIDPDDLFILFGKLINVGSVSNCAVDCFSKAPLGKLELLENLSLNFKFNYRLTDNLMVNNPTGNKVSYYSENYRAKDFGFEPTMTAMESVFKELRLAL